MWFVLAGVAYTGKHAQAKDSSKQGGCSRRKQDVSPYGSAIHPEMHALDGIDYELIVYAASGGLYRTFHCPDCGYTGVSPLMSGTEQDALHHAWRSMESHHRMQSHRQLATA